jgi:hypothetical protein
MIMCWRKRVILASTLNCFKCSSELIVPTDLDWFTILLNFVLLLYAVREHFVNELTAVGDISIDTNNKVCTQIPVRHTKKIYQNVRCHYRETLNCWTKSLSWNQLSLSLSKARCNHRNLHLAPHQQNHSEVQPIKGRPSPKHLWNKRQLGERRQPKANLLSLLQAVHQEGVCALEIRLHQLHTQIPHHQPGNVSGHQE